MDELNKLWDFPDSSVGKETTCNAGDPSSISGSGRSAGEGKGYPLQYSGLENSMDRIVHRITKSQTQLTSLHLNKLWYIQMEYYVVIKNSYKGLHLLMNRFHDILLHKRKAG